MLTAVEYLTVIRDERINIRDLVERKIGRLRNLAAQGTPDMPLVSEQELDDAACELSLACIDVAMAELELLRAQS